MSEDQVVKEIMTTEGVGYSRAVEIMRQRAGERDDDLPNHVSVTGEEALVLTALRERLTESAAAQVKARFAYLMRALALAQKNNEAKDQKATLRLTLTLWRESDDTYAWEAKADVSHPAVDKGEVVSGNYDPRQAALPGMG